jgi:hypothetical protein
MKYRAFQHRGVPEHFVRPGEVIFWGGARHNGEGGVI